MFGRCASSTNYSGCSARRAISGWRTGPFVPKAVSLRLDEQLLAPVAHRHLVLTIPKRLRAYFLYDRRRLGLLSRVASRTLHAYVRAALGEPDAVPGVISLAQSFGSLARWHPRLHLVLTDGAFRRDGSFVTQFAHDPAVLAGAWRRAVLSMFVR